MKLKKILRILLIVALTLIIILIINSIKTRPFNGDISKMNSDGIGLKYYSFDRENRKGIEVECVESKRIDKDKLFLKGIKARILRKGKLEDDIVIESEKGYVTNDYHDFELVGKTRIYSKSFDLKGKYFYFKNRNRLTSDKIVEYKMKKVKGIAYKGMLYSVKVNLISFRNTKGVFKKNNEDFEYNTDELRFLKKNKIIIFKDNSTIKGDRILIKSSKIHFKFDDDIKHLKKITTFKRTFIKIIDKNGYKIVESKNSNLYLNSDEIIDKIIFTKNVNMKILNKKNNLNINSDLINLKFNKTGEYVQKVLMPHKNILLFKGKSDLKLISNKLEVNFNEKREIKNIKSFGSISFSYNNIKGLTNILNYDIKNEIINIFGKKTKLFAKNGEFKSNSFSVNTKNEIIKSNSEVTSIINFNKKNMIFEKSPVYINSEKIEINEKKDSITFTDNVKLIQNETNIKTDKLVFYDKENLLLEGKSGFIFKNNDNEIAIKGNKIEFIPKTNMIKIIDNGVIKSGVNILKADEIYIEFNNKNFSIDMIKAKNNIQFNKEDVEGKSRILDWLYSKEIVIFKGEPEIINQNGTTTKGDILKFDLKTDKIEIISKSLKKTETTID